MRTIIIAFVLASLNIDLGIHLDLAAVDKFQDRPTAPTTARDLQSAGDFFIGANAKAILDPHHLRSIVAYVAANKFTLANTRSIFRHLSEEYPSDDFLVIDAVSNITELDRKIAWFERIEKHPFGDVAPLGCGTNKKPAPLSAVYYRTATGEYMDYCDASGESSAIHFRRLSYGCNSPNDSTPDLVGATISSCKEVVERLLDSGADPNVKSPEGWSPVFEAAYRSQEEILRLLLDRGADINQRSSSGWTPLIAATNRDRCFSIVELLLSRGADINARNEEGRTALIYAVLHKNEAVVRLLLAAGADVKLKDGYGKTALMIAQEEALDEYVIRLLKAAGAR